MILRTSALEKFPLEMGDVCSGWTTNAFSSATTIANMRRDEYRRHTFLFTNCHSERFNSL